MAGGIVAGGKNDLAIAGQIERASLAAFIDDGDAAYFQIVPMRNADCHADRDAVVAPMIFNLMSMEQGVHVRISRSDRLRRYRPEFTGGAIADIDPQTRTSGSCSCPNQSMAVPR